MTVLAKAAIDRRSTGYFRLFGSFAVALLVAVLPVIAVRVFNEEGGHKHL
jgi:hypothetical protein